MIVKRCKAWTFVQPQMLDKNRGEEKFNALMDFQCDKSGLIVKDSGLLELQVHDYDK